MAKETKTMRNMFHLSFGEEVGNAITHGVMAILCLFPSLPPKKQVRNKKNQ